MKRLAGLTSAHRFTAARHSSIALLARAAASAASAPAAAPSAPAPPAALTTLAAFASLTHARAAVAIRSREGRAVAACVLPSGARTRLNLVGGSFCARRLIAAMLVTVSLLHALALLLCAFALVSALTRALIAALAASIPISAAIPVAIAVSAVAPLAPVSPFTTIASVTPIATMARVRVPMTRVISPAIAAPIAMVAALAVARGSTPRRCGRSRLRLYGNRSGLAAE